MTAAVASPLSGTRAGRSTADLQAVPSGHPRLRGLPYLTPVPECEPPFDDELEAGPAMTVPAVGAARAATANIPAPLAATASSTGTSWGARPASGVSGERMGAIGTRTPPGAPRHGQRRSSAAGGPVGSAGGPTTITAPGVPSWSSESDIGVRKTATVELPPAQRAASVFARALVEVLSGRRPLAQLRVHCAPDIYAGLVDRPIAGSLSLPHLLTVRVCEPADGVAEVSAAFRRADRVRALAFRIQGVDGRWRITALQVG